MARGIAESGLFRQERVKLNGRTSDPSSPEPGESWLRFDLDGETDKYGEFRVYDGSSVQSVAIVAPGTTQTEAEEVLRVQTPSGVGVIPVSPRADASIPQWSFQHNGNSLGLGQPSAIPDGGDLQARYDWTQASGTSTVTDQTGNGFDLSGTYTGPTVTINGNQAGRFDAANEDELDVSFTAESTPVSIFLVVRFESLSTSGPKYVFDSADSSFQIFLNATDTRYQFGGSSFYDGGTPDLNNHVFSAIYRADNNTSELFIDGGNTPIASGDIGINSLQGFLVGDSSDSTARNADFSIGEVLIYPQDKGGIRGDIESYLSDKWGVTI
jgi:hypothetical protein